MNTQKLIERNLKPGKKVTVRFNGKNMPGVIDVNPVYGHYNNKTDSFYVRLHNGLHVFIDTEDILEGNYIRNVVPEIYKGVSNVKLNNKLFTTINEELTKDDFREIRDLIRKEMALLFYDLFKKKNVWM